MWKDLSGLHFDSDNDIIATVDHYKEGQRQRLQREDPYAPQLQENKHSNRCILLLTAEEYSVCGVCLGTRVPFELDP